MVKNILLWVVVAIVMMTAFEGFNSNFGNNNTVAYSTFLNDIRTNTLKDVDMKSNSETISVTKKDGTKYQTVMPMYDRDLLADLSKTDATVTGQPEERRNVFVQLLISSFPIIILIGFWVFYMRQMQGGGGKGAFSFGKSKAKMLTADQVKTTFADVAGCDEAKEEVGEVVDFLRDPSKFQKLGGRIPKGILMVGPPGTGKTLLAKAIAGEAKVPFFTMAGSDFVEMFVGVGASRVRDLFCQAKKNAPCIIFIDEIDAVGRQRGAGLGGGHDEREQTLNQLLVEMDGFGANEGIITLAATNRPDILDPALLRPGRFDRQVVVGRPDLHGREAILKVHARNKPLADDVDLKTIAKKTPGFTGADLSNLLNEAALLAARLNKKVITMAELEEASEKVSMGPERRSHIVSEKDRKLTAYHESGHAIVAHLLPHANPVHKVTIIPRGYAGGYTMMLPKEEHDYKTKAQLLADIRVALGGRIAEALVLGDISTGASGDLQSVTNTARSMVTRWGMSDTLGPIVFGEQQEQVFLGKNIGHERNYSEEVASKIDVEIHHIVDEAYRDVEQLLTDNMDFLHNMAKALLEEETIDAKAVENLHKYGTTKAPDETEAPTASHMDAVISMPNATEETKTSSTESDVQS